MRRHTLTQINRDCWQFFVRRRVVRLRPDADPQIQLQGYGRRFDFTDSVGGANGTLNNAGASNPNSASLDGSQLQLDGTGGYAGPAERADQH